MDNSPLHLFTDWNFTLSSSDKPKVQALGRNSLRNSSIGIGPTKFGAILLHVKVTLVMRRGARLRTRNFPTDGNIEDAQLYRGPVALGGVVDRFLWMKSRLN